MTTFNQSKHSRSALAFAAILSAAGVLAACNGGGVTPSASTSNSGGSGSGGSGSGGGGSGGGGTTASVSPYLLYASNYVVFPTGGTAATNNSYLASIQGGNVYAGSSTNVAYGNYSSTQANLDQTQFYNIQWQWKVAGGGAGDYAYVSIVAPGSGPAYTSLTPFDISQSSKLLIVLGNTYTQSDNPAGTVGGNASIFTVVLDNDTSLAQDGSGSTATCSFDQQLLSVGRNAAVNPLPLGVSNYVIPLASFTTCSKGSVATLQSTGITSVAVKITGDQNPNLVANEYDTIAVGYVGFTL
jgi:hypothetical protein